MSDDIPALPWRKGSPPKPTVQACLAHEEVTWTDEHGRLHAGWACMYPQMGGYGGCCVVEPGVDEDQHGKRGGFEAWVWHDGEFAFGDEKEPRRLHHCSARQFLDFAVFVISVGGE